jgi:hypothetical protein
MAKFEKGMPRPANAGRKKGARNKVTVSIVQAYIEAFERLGGVESLLKWVQSGPQARGAFYTHVLPRLVPTQITGADGGPIEFKQAERDELSDKILASAAAVGRSEAPAPPAGLTH